MSLHKKYIRKQGEAKVKLNHHLLQNKIFFNIIAADKNLCIKIKF